MRIPEFKGTENPSRVIFCGTLRCFGVRSVINIPDRGRAELRELSHRSLGQHRKGKVSYRDLYPVIAPTHESSDICVRRFAPGASATVRGVQSGCDNISAESRSHLATGKELRVRGGMKRKEKAIIDKLCSIGPLWRRNALRMDGRR